MKFLIVLVVVACGIGFSEALSKEKRWEMFKIMITDCAKQEGAPQSDLDLILSKQAPATPQGICIGACVGEASGMIKDNKINVEATVSVTKMAFDGDAEKMALAREFATACADVTDADRCQAAFKVFECMKKLAIDKGIKYDEM